jgi:hypothetical protein
MLDLLEREIRFHDITPLSGERYRFNEKDLSYDDIISLLKNRAEQNKTLLLSLWMEIKSIAQEKSFGHAEEYTVRLFLPAVESLYRMALSFTSLFKRGVVGSLYAVMCKDSADLSSRFMRKFIEYRLGIEWTHHLIMKDNYICAVLADYKKQKSASLMPVARGTPGPWSNLDLPYGERVYPWSQVEDELTSRTKQREAQPRYTMGLESYNNPRVGEGFVWEEVRRYPYDFDSEEDNIYPHRNLLWKS